VIAVNGVTHRFDDRTVLRDVSVELGEQRIGIIGANGSGKSTFVRLLNALVRPSEGTVTVNGLSTSSDARQVRREVGFSFTNPDSQILMPTVADDVAFSLRRSELPRGERAARVQRTLERLGLAAVADQPAHALSGGQKQLLALASILVMDPRVLVCDEPTTLLDLRHARRVQDLLTSLPQQLILVTHHLDLVCELDRVLVFDEGRVVADGEPRECVATYRRLML